MRTIACPPIFGLSDMRELLTKLGVIYRKAHHASAAEYRPRASEQGVRLDLSRVDVISAECASMLEAIIAWIREQQDSESRLAPGLTTSDEQFLRPYLRATSSSPPNRPTSTMIVPPRLVTLPNLGKAIGESTRVSDAAVAEVTTVISELHTSFVGGLKGIRAGYRSEGQLADWAEEFIAEALFNVAQHSDPGGTGAVVQAYVAARFISLQDMRTLAARDVGLEDSHAELNWIARAGNSATGFVDIAISDLGVGVPRSLGSAFVQRKQPDVGESTALNGPTEAPVDDDVITWALSPFGTRKSVHDLIAQQNEFSWRGLYRLLRRCENYDGVLRLTSATGSVSALSDDEGRRITTKPRRTRPLSPVTTVRAVLPVPTRQLPRAKRPSSSGGKELIGAVAGIISAPRSASSINQGDHGGIDAYVRSLVARASTQIGSSRENELPWLVIHGIGTASSPSQPSSIHPNNSPRRTELMASALLRVILPLLGPTHTLVHCFLPNTESDAVLETLAEYLHTFASQVPSPLAGSRMGQVGIALNSRNEVVWLTSHRPPEHGVKPRASATRLWQRLISYQPLASTRQAAQTSRLHPDLARQAASAFLSGRVHSALSAIEPSPQDSWIWRARQRDGKAIEAVRTRTGRLTTHYLSVLGLCAAYPTFLNSLTTALLFAIYSWNAESESQETPIYVVPDSESSRFLMYRVQSQFRAYERRAGRTANTVFIGSLRSRNFGVSRQRVLLFSDYRQQGNMAKAMHAELVEAVESQTRASLRLFLAVDSVDLSQGDPNQSQFEVIYRYGYFDRLPELPLSQGASSLSIDPITNEPYTMEQTARADLLRSLTWRRSDDEPELDLSQTVFECGIQQIGGRIATIRWPVARNLNSPIIRSSVAKRIVDFAMVDSGEAAVCICYRRDSSIRVHIDQIVDAVTELLKQEREKGSGVLWIAEIASHTFHGKQHLGGFIQQGLRNAVKRVTDLAQYSLALSDGTEAPTDAPNFTHLVYLDNSAITGRAIQELLLAVQDLPRPGLARPRRVLVFPLITRLSPVEEGFLRSIQLATPVESMAGDAPVAISVEYASVIQLRVRSYRSVSDVPLYAELQRVFRLAQLNESHDLRDLTDAIGRALRTMATLGPAEGSALHFGSALGLSLAADQSSHRVSPAVVALRQLLALAQQGIPCAGEVISALDSLQSVNDGGLVNVLAFEPDLIASDPLVQELLGPVTRYVLHVAEKARDAMTLSNAIWVLAHMPHGMTQLIRRSSEQLLGDEQTQRLVVFLALYCQAPEAQLELQHAIERRRSEGALPAWLEQRGRTLVSSAIDEKSGDVFAVESVDDARLAVVQYIADGRGDHVGTLADNWKKARLKIDQAIVAAARVDSPHTLFDEESLQHTDDWVKIVSVRAQRGIELLLYSDPKGRQSVRGERRDAVQTLANLRRLVEGIPQGATGVIDVAAAWRSLLRVTLSGTTEDLYLASALRKSGAPDIRKRVDHILGATSESAVKLPLIASPPLYVLFGALLHALGANVDVDLVYAAFRQDQPTVRTSRKLADVLDDRPLVGALWYSSLDLPLLWQQRRSDFEIISKLLADNLSKYANLSAPLRIEFSRDHAGHPDNLSLRVSSLKGDRPSGAGGGAGQLQMNSYASRNGWVMEHDLAAPRFKSEYVSELRFTAEWLPLARR